MRGLNSFSASTSSRFNEGRIAFTLLELVVGLVLLATLLISVLLGATRHNRMLKLADDRQLAIALADEMLVGWHDSRDGIPLRGRGVMQGQVNWYWRTHVDSNRSVFGSMMPVVSLDIVRVNSERREDVLVSIETLRVIRPAYSEAN